MKGINGQRSQAVQPSVPGGTSGDATKREKSPNCRDHLFGFLSSSSILVQLLFYHVSSLILKKFLKTLSPLFKNQSSVGKLI